MNSNPSVSDPQAFAKLQSLINRISVAMLTTVGADGALRSRPMQTRLAEADGTLWFFTDDYSELVREVSEEHQVGLTYAEPKQQQYVSVSGTATLVHDRERMRQLWHPAVKAYFPRGLDDPRLALLRVRIESAEYWDAPTNRMVQAYAFARSILTGDRAAIGDHKHVDVQGFAPRK
jgi:general stress protein 26